ncbi:MAG TPA: ERF family protein [Bacteroidales bacterium]|nr:ERF family protein [Bacteroidales bacterium]
MENINEIMIAIGKFQDECPKIDLDETVIVKTSQGQYNFKFASMKKIVAVTKEPLHRNELVYTFTVNEDGAVTCLLCHTKSKQVLTSSLKATKEGMKAQEIGSAITYSKRYLLSAILGIITDQDDDGNSADGNAMVRKDSPAETPDPEKKGAELFKKDEIEAPARAIKKVVGANEAKQHWDGNILEGKYIKLQGVLIEPAAGQLERLKKLPQYKS